MKTTSRGLRSALMAITLAATTALSIGEPTAAHAAGMSLLNAPVPASCKHPATTLDGYEKDYPTTNGHTTLQVAQAVSGRLAHRRGRVTVVPLSCSAAGVTWPDLLLVYGPGPSLLGSLQLRTQVRGQKHATVSALSLSGGVAQMTVTTSNATGYMLTTYHSTMGWSQGYPTFRLGPPLTIDGAPAGSDEGAMPLIGGPQQAARLKPAPAGLRAFLQRQMDANPNAAYTKLMRYSHKGGGFAYIDWDPGDEEGDVYGKVHRRWTHLATYWNRGDISASCNSGDQGWFDLTGKTRAAWTALGLACRTTNGHWSTLGTWPSSGI